MVHHDIARRCHGKHFPVNPNYLLNAWYTLNRGELDLSNHISLRMRKVIVLLLVLLLSTASVFADSFTLSTEINGVSSAPDGVDFGLGYLPAGTNWEYVKYIPVVPDYHALQLDIEIELSLRHEWLPSDYDWSNGHPRWASNYRDNWSYQYIGGRYFRPYSYIQLYAQQGFFQNPFQSWRDPLVSVRLGYYTRYTMALEQLWTNNDLRFVDALGNPITPFSSDIILSSPWLNGNRKVWNNMLFLKTEWNLNKDTGFDTYDGLYAETLFEYGPKWLMNSLSPSGIVTSDFWRARLHLEERLTLFVEKQHDGKNWMLLYVGHSNSLSYVGGDVVPDYRIPADRLRFTLEDRLWLRFMGPQFMAADCYTYIELSLWNGLFGGEVVNTTAEGATKAVELQTSINTTFHLRLFGFVRFEYTCGYNFARGIWASNPGWWQSAGISLYVSI